MKKWTAIVLAAALLLGGCASPTASVNLMEDVPARVICLAEEPADRAPATADFGIRLLRENLTPGQNTLVSPLSVLCALGMTMNGAQGKTLAQMEAVLGMPAEDLNVFLYSYMDPQREALKLANAVWFRDSGLAVKDAFLETNANYYHADVFKAPMGESTRNDINGWVKEKTDGRIEEILDEIPGGAFMYLVNALAFEAAWPEPYREDQVREGTFTREDGTAQTAQLMHSQEGYYLEDENATGFLKYYEGGNYAFAALLPNEGVTVSQYLSALTGEHLVEMLRDPQEIPVYAAIPKFETAYDAELSESLQAMGMTEAFDSAAADFSGMGTVEDGNLFIGRVLHKTCISVAEQGTEAGAATAVEMNATGSLLEETRSVTLNRPFVYMLIDCETRLPFFIGTLADLDSAGLAAE